MTINEIMASDKNMLTAADVAECIETDPGLIRYQAKNDPSKLGFNVIVLGTRTKIPRIPFLRYVIGYESINDMLNCLIMLHPELSAVLTEKFDEIKKLIGGAQNA